MVNWLLERRQGMPAAGVVLGEQQLRFVVLRRYAYHWQAQSGGVMPWVDDMQSTWRALKARLKPYGIKRINLGLSPNEVLIKQYRLASGLVDDEIYCYLQQQARQCFDDDTELLALDYEPIVGGVDNNSDRQWVRMVAARQRQLKDYFYSCRQVGLAINIVDVSVNALKQVVALITPVPNSAFAIVLVERQGLVFLVLENNAILYMKQFNYPQIEQHKQHVTDTIVATLSQALQYYCNEDNCPAINTIILAGELATASEAALVDAYPQHQISVIQFNPSCFHINPKSELNKNYLPLVSSIGLALQASHYAH